MHAKEILIALVLPLFAMAAEKKSAAPVYEQFTQGIDRLEASLKAEADVRKRYDLFLQSHAELTKLRKDNPRQNEIDELSMSSFFDALLSLPAKSKFDPKKCEAYGKESRRQMAKPKSEDATGDDPLVLRAWQIIDLICRKK